MYFLILHHNVAVNSPTVMDDSWQKFMNPMNDDAVGPAGRGRPISRTSSLTHSLHPSHSILGVALHGWRNRHPSVHPSLPSTSPLPTQPCPALPTLPTHAFFRRSTDTIRCGEGRAGRRASRRRGHSHPARRVHATEVEKRGRRREERPRDFRAGIIMQQRCSGLEGGRRGGSGMEEEREKSVRRTMQRFFYDETENEGRKGWVRKTTAAATFTVRGSRTIKAALPTTTDARAAPRVEQPLNLLPLI